MNIFVEKIIIMTDSDVDGSKITSLLCAFFMYHMPELVEQGYIYKVQAPLYKIVSKGKEIYLKDNKEYAKYIQNLISSELNIELVVGKTSVKMTKKEVVDLIERTRSYSRNLYRLSRAFVCNPLLIELCALYHKDIEKENIKKIEKSIGDQFTFMNVIKEKKGYALEGYINQDYQYLRLNKRLVEYIEPIIKHIEKKEDANIFYKVNGEKMSLYSLLKMVEKFEPPHAQRYKGLGELKPQQLAETTLNFENCNLIQLTCKDCKKDIDKMQILHNKKEKWKLERQNMMSKFKIDIDDLDS